MLPVKADKSSLQAPAGPRVEFGGYLRPGPFPGSSRGTRTSD